jgi:hypothetical protein
MGRAATLNALITASLRFFHRFGENRRSRRAPMRRRMKRTAAATPPAKAGSLEEEYTSGTPEPPLKIWMTGGWMTGG